MGYRSVKKYDDALIAFEQMQYAGAEPNRVTKVNALAACTSFGAVEMGVWIHDFIRRREWEVDVILGTALIDMYGKCGRIEDGLRVVFQGMKEKNAFIWNAVIKWLALAKSGQDAVWWFNKMEQEGLKTDEVALVGVLCACSHSGLVDIGRVIFSSLIHGVYGFAPGINHYACMIDLFARAGYIEDAFQLITEMPFWPTENMWGSLLAGCRDKGNRELSEFVTKKHLELEPDNSAYYVVLSIFYAEWEDGVIWKK